MLVERYAYELERYLANWRDELWAVGITVGAVLLALVVHRILLALGRRLAHSKGEAFYRLLAQHQEGPTRLLLVFQCAGAGGFLPGSNDVGIQSGDELNPRNNFPDQVFIVRQK